jgi:hypothetical protein
MYFFFKTNTFIYFSMINQDGCNDWEVNDDILDMCIKGNFTNLYTALNSNEFKNNQNNYMNNENNNDNHNSGLLLVTSAKFNHIKIFKYLIKRYDVINRNVNVKFSNNHQPHICLNLDYKIVIGYKDIYRLDHFKHIQNLYKTFYNYDLSCGQYVPVNFPKQKQSAMAYQIIAEDKVNDRNYFWSYLHLSLVYAAQNNNIKIFKYILKHKLIQINSFLFDDVLRYAIYLAYAYMSIDVIIYCLRHFNIKKYFKPKNFREMFPFPNILYGWLAYKLLIMDDRLDETTKNQIIRRKNLVARVEKIINKFKKRIF